MNILYDKAFAALLIFLVSVLAIVYPLKKYSTEHVTKNLELGESFASGIFLGVALFHMLPAARESFEVLWPTVKYPITEVICSIGFVFLLFIERCSVFGAGCQHHVSLPYLFAFMLAVHSLIEGTVLGLNVDASMVAMVFIAIIAHKGSASFALCVTFIRKKINALVIAILMLGFSLVTPIGILFGTVLHNCSYLPGASLLAAIFNAGAAGSFLYMSTLHHVQFHQRTTECWQGWLEFLLLAIGLTIMACVAVWL